MVTLSDIAAAVGATAHLEAELDDVTADSRAAAPGALFAAVPGARSHGALFAAQALERGASAVLTDAAGLELIARDDVPVLVLDRVERRVGEVAALVHGEPAKRLRAFAVTGTNGKTTTTFMLEHLLASAGFAPGLIGGVEIRVGGASSPAALTSPMPAELQRMLARHVAAGGTDIVMEVSSHALVQHRSDPVRFAVAGFTNLTQDHLDYHPTIEEYFEAKTELFTRERCESAVILVDDDWGRRLFALASSRLERVYALAIDSRLPGGAPGWQAKRLEDRHGFALLAGGAGAPGAAAGERLGEFEVGLDGDFNVANAALAATMALAGGVPLEALPRRIDPAVPGRMEQVSEREEGPRVVVDFAHNADALVKAIEALRPSTGGRLVVLTGSAGDRDAGKRALMGAVVARYADAVVITDDDPHGEPPEAIRRALLDGATGLGTPVREIPGRAEAIRSAILEAGEADTLLIAGRGHETEQEVAGEVFELDDRVVARAALEERRALAPRGSGRIA